jgi:hypothetical protein
MEMSKMICDLRFAIYALALNGDAQIQSDDVSDFPLDGNVRIQLARANRESQIVNQKC